MSTVKVTVELSQYTDFSRRARCWEAYIADPIPTGIKASQRGRSRTSKESALTDLARRVRTESGLEIEIAEIVLC